MERQLKAVFAADMVGYSRLIEADETGTIKRLKVHLSELINPAIEKHRGKTVKLMGDGILAEFASVVDAVRCAAEIQRAILKQEAEVPEDSRIAFRIGVNLGDVVVENGDILGDGVNIAARLEQLAEPGGICISGTAFDHLKSNIDVGYQSLGEITVKNISHPVRAYRVLTEPGHAGALIAKPKNPAAGYLWLAAAVLALAVAAGGGWWWNQQPDFKPVEPTSMALELPKEPSIAVLPFDYLGADKANNEYLADGLSENITTYLSKIPDMLVIARNSSFTFKGKSVDVREVSKQFGVRYVVEGSVQKSGDKLRVTAQLIDAVAGKHLWAGTYDRNADDLFAIQDEITLAVIHNIYDRTISGDQILRARPKTLQAYSEFRKGVAERQQFTAKGNILARSHFEKTLELDPDFVDAVSEIGFTHLMDARLGLVADPARSLKLAEQFLEEALSLDGDHPSALNTMAILRVIQKRGDEAKSLVLKASELAPGNPGFLGSVGWVLKYTGDAKASLPYFSRAMRQQPVHEWWLVADYYTALLDVEDFDTAATLSDELVELSPEIYLPVLTAAAAAAPWKSGDTEKARTLMERALKMKPDLSVQDFLPFDFPYLDKSIPQKRYAILREMGIPDKPVPSRPDTPSIAVLPFVNASGDPDQAYFATGISEDISTDLSRIADLRVTSPGTAEGAAKTSADPLAIAKALGVGHVLEGSVRRAGKQIRITARLIEAGSGNQVWAERYDRETSDIFAIQDDIAERVVNRLSEKFGGPALDRAERSYTPDIEAYDLYIQGRAKRIPPTPPNLKAALSAFDMAIEIDPQFAGGYAGASVVHVLLSADSTVEAGMQTDHLAVAHELAKKAVMLDPEFGPAWGSLAEAQFRLRDYESALKSAELAIEKAPADSLMRANYGRYLGHVGRAAEGIEQVKTAMRMSPDSLPMLYFLGAGYRANGDFDQAVDALAEHRKRLGGRVLPGPTVQLIAAYVQAGRLEDARSEVAKLLEAAPGYSAGRAAMTHPYRNPEDEARFTGALVEAGLPR